MCIYISLIFYFRALFVFVDQENAALAEQLESLEEEIQRVQAQKRSEAACTYSALFFPLHVYARLRVGIDLWWCHRSVAHRFLLRRLLELKNKEGKRAARTSAKPQFRRILPATAVHGASAPLALASANITKPSSGGGTAKGTALSRPKKQSTKPMKVKETPTQQHKPAPPSTIGSFGGKGLNRPQILEPSDLFSSGSSSNSDDEAIDVSGISSAQRVSVGSRRSGSKNDEGACGTQQLSCDLGTFAYSGYSH